VFVTGHTGFKGSWLAFLLNEVGAEVMGYALKPCTTPNHFELLQLDRKISSVIGDIRDGPGVLSAIQSFQPEFVFHLAAQALVSSSYADPVLTFETNILGSINILEAVRQAGSVRSLVYITSDKCYENLEWVWGYRENDRLGGHDPYSASKAAAEIAFSAYAKSFFSSRPDLGAASARAGNVIGLTIESFLIAYVPRLRMRQSNCVVLKRRVPGSTCWSHYLDTCFSHID
jgi:CDP-glucose 4,6-dehydratase